MKSDKDPFKLTSIDEDGGHLNIIPAEVSGYFQRHRARVHFILLIIFLALPWIYYQGKPLILLDIAKREFIFLGTTFQSHDAPLIFLILAIATLTLAFVTSLWGRVWCGWACPQTVFIDSVYRKIEILIEGNYIERRKLQSAPWTFSKFLKKSIKWLIFTFVSTLFAHSFVAYFTGSHELLLMMQGPPSANWNYFLLIVSFTALVLFDFAWFREQFCVIMCPYGRIQSILLDPSSLAVVYNQERGEPRKGAALQGGRTGDCVSCNRCVEVCPTGIDIRNGLQMECISCTACIDACDAIMEKVNKPKGLISYRTLDGSAFRFSKLKTAFYGFLILLFSGVLIYNIEARATANITVLRAIEAPYSQTQDSEGNALITNHFRIHLTSQSDKSFNYYVQLPKEDNDKGLKLTVGQNPILLKAKSSETWHVFVQLPQALIPASGKVNFNLLIKTDDGTEQIYNLTFIGPTS